MDSYKLQKLLYYTQAWHLAWYDEPLFNNPIEAWSNGPVVRDVYNAHSGTYTVEVIGRSDATALTEQQRQAVSAVVDRYSEFSGRTLSEMTHAEGPWQITRSGLPPHARSDRVIAPHLMRDYYRAFGDSRPIAVEPPSPGVVKSAAQGDIDEVLNYITGGRAVVSSND
jgi:uncharacterized phage-associated protein